MLLGINCIAVDLRVCLVEFIINCCHEFVSCPGTKTLVVFGPMLFPLRKLGPSRIIALSLKFAYAYGSYVAMARYLTVCRHSRYSGVRLVWHVRRYISCVLTACDGASGSYVSVCVCVFTRVCVLLVNSPPCFSELVAMSGQCQLMV